jgi:hypothetical protein
MAWVRMQVQPLHSLERDVAVSRRPPSWPWWYTVSWPSVPTAAADTSGLPATTHASLWAVDQRARPSTPQRPALLSPLGTLHSRPSQARLTSVALSQPGTLRVVTPGCRGRT